MVIEGPKACGKTATARRAAASEVLLDVDDDARRAAQIDPSLILDGAVPRLLDEWQVEPAVWNHVRRAVDDRGVPGQFILTGSSVPPDDITRHSGAGRLSRLRMRPMSLFELGRSTGEVSLLAAMTGGPVRSGDAGLTVPDVAEEIGLGGWPGFRGLTTDAGLRAVRDYLGEVVRVDVERVDGTRRDPDRVLRLVRSLARNVATHVSAATLAADTGGDEGPLKDETAREYLAALSRLLIVEDLPAWSPSMRSRSPLRAAAKRHFVDPSLAVAALGSSPDRLLADLNTLGYLFESLVVRDLRIYAQTFGARVLQFRESGGSEFDAVVEGPDGSWAGFEVKLGRGQVDAAAASLTRAAAKVGGPEPALLAVVVATGYGYVRDDGVAVIPIGALGP